MPAKSRILLVSGTLILIVLIFVFSTSSKTIDYSTQVKPILNTKCITCHGGVKKEGGFSLLFAAEAFAKTESGKYAIIPGDPENSEMIRRIHLKDPEERMPYKEDPLTEKEKDILETWIRQGAKWGDHWAYLPVKKPAIPQPESSFFGLMPAEKWDWVNNDIDRFIYQKLQQLELKPSPEADKASLLRRASLDLTGLLPSASLAQRFLASKDPKAYEMLLDSLLASPAYGEKWTSMWLDLARYADTKGYERDAGRQIWRYRDWLIKAFNEDKPYDKFLTEQLAGDLLPSPTNEQFIATAYHRNTMTNDEGGTDNEEFRTAAVVDRVNTTWETLMGTTFSCVQCHSHPYDPFKHEEYYKFMAFFNNSRDEDTYAEYPVLRHYETEDSLKVIAVKDWLKNNGFQAEAAEAEMFLKTWQPAINSLKADEFNNAELNDTKWLAMRSPSTARLKGVQLTGKTQLILRYEAYVEGGTWTIRLDKQDGPVLKKIILPQTKGFTMMKIDLPEQQGVHDLHFSYNNPNITNPEASATRFDWFYFTKPFPGKGKPGYDSAYAHYWTLLTKTRVPGTPIMMDNPADMQRATHVFERGNWMVKGEEVQAGVPEVLNRFPANAPKNRLGLAMWMTDKKNPLTARTMVNRLWEQLFGTGLVETLEDMGTQGAEPTHQELLDYLSWKFMNDLDWSTKKLLKEMMMSATYRQDSKVSADALEKDRFNRYYSHGPRVRLSAEQLRDQALQVSGKLSRKMYGPGVMPWQPQGIWNSPWSNEYWKQSEGEDQYRRAIYTYWKRTAPYPSMITFDAVGREVCIARRIRTNTPLHALVTLNDSVYIEASRHLAFRMQSETSGSDIRKTIARGYELAMFKPISPAKLNVLESLYRQSLNMYKNEPDKACEMVGMDDEHNKPETAALVVVANSLLNLDEFITKN